MSHQTENSALDELLNNYEPIKLSEIRDLLENSSDSSIALSKASDATDTNDALNNTVLEDDVFINEKKNEDIKKSENSDATETNVLNRSMIEDSQSVNSSENSVKTPEKNIPEKENESPFENPFFISKRLSFASNTYSDRKNPFNLGKLEFKTPARKNVLCELSLNNKSEVERTPFEKKSIHLLQTPKSLQNNKPWTPLHKNQSNHSVTFPELNKSNVLENLNRLNKNESSNSSDNKKTAEVINDDDTEQFENPFCVSKRFSSSHTYGGKNNPFTLEKVDFQTPIQTRKPSKSVDIQVENKPTQLFPNQNTKFNDSNRSATFPEVEKLSIVNYQESTFKQFKTPISKFRENDQQRIEKKSFKIDENIDNKQETNLMHNKHETIPKDSIQHQNYNQNCTKSTETYNKVVYSQNTRPVNKIEQRRPLENVQRTYKNDSENSIYSDIQHRNTSEISKKVILNENRRPFTEKIERHSESIKYNDEKLHHRSHQTPALNVRNIENESVKKEVVKSLEFVEREEFYESSILSPIIEECSSEIRRKIEYKSPEWEQNSTNNQNRKKIISPEWEISYKNEQVDKRNVKRLLQNDEPAIALKQNVINANVQKPCENIRNDNNFVKPNEVKSNVSVNSVVKNFRNLIVKKKTYILISKLGEGGTCQVFDCLEPETLQHRAIKIVNLSADAVTANGCINEVKMLKALQGSEYVIKIFDYEISNNTLFVVMEKGGIDLSVFLRNIANKSSFLPIHVINYYWMEMLNCVKEIHDAGIIHSDLKPSNFLIVDGRLKLIDFGIASRLSSDMTSVIKNVQVGTFNYISPEALLDSRGGSPVLDGKPRIKISYKSDVWSLGCILYQLVYRKTPFHNIGNTYAKISMIIDPNHKIEYPNLGHVPIKMIDTIKKCLQYDMKIRPTVVELIAMTNFNS